MTTLTITLLGLLFLVKNSTILYVRQGVFNFYFSSMQLKQADSTYSNMNEPLKNPTEILIQPGRQTVIHIKLEIYTLNEVTSIIQPSHDLEDIDDLIICPALKTNRNRKNPVHIKNFLEHPYTLKKRHHIPIFSILTSKQAKNKKPINPAAIRHFFRHKSWWRHPVGKRNIDNAQTWRA